MGLGSFFFLILSELWMANWAFLILKGPLALDFNTCDILDLNNGINLLIYQLLRLNWRLGWWLICWAKLKCCLMLLISFRLTVKKDLVEVPWLKSNPITGKPALTLLLEENLYSLKILLFTWSLLWRSLYCLV